MSKDEKKLDIERSDFKKFKAQIESQIGKTKNKPKLLSVFNYLFKKDYLFKVATNKTVYLHREITNLPYSVQIKKTETGYKVIIGLKRKEEDWQAVGAYKKVKSCLIFENGELISGADAIVYPDETDKNNEDLTSTRREIELTKEIKSNDIHRIEEGASYKHQGKDKVSFFSPRAAMDLSKLSTNFQGLDFLDMLTICYSSAKALAATHEAGIAHQDIKLDNFLLFRDKKGVFWSKLADFGLAVKTNENIKYARGTAGYISPEHLAAIDADKNFTDRDYHLVKNLSWNSKAVNAIQENHHTKKPIVPRSKPHPKNDVYAFGFMLKELITKHFQENFHHYSPELRKASARLLEIVEKMCNPHRDDRIDMQQFLTEFDQFLADFHKQNHSVADKAIQSLHERYGSAKVLAPVPESKSKSSTSSAFFKSVEPQTIPKDKTTTFYVTAALPPQKTVEKIMGSISFSQKHANPNVSIGGVVKFAIFDTKEAAMASSKLLNLAVIEFSCTHPNTREASIKSENLKNVYDGRGKVVNIIDIKPNKGILDEKIQALENILNRIETHQYELGGGKHPITTKAGKTMRVSTGAQLIHRRITEVLNGEKTPATIKSAFQFVQSTLETRREETSGYLYFFKKRYQSTVGLYKELLNLSEAQIGASFSIGAGVR